MQVGSREQTAKPFVWCGVIFFFFFFKWSKACSGHVYCTGEQTGALFTPLLGTNSSCTADQPPTKKGNVYCMTFFSLCKGGEGTSIAGLWKQL